MTKLAPCPDCKNMCSLTATACPKCGRVFAEGDLVAPEAKSMSAGGWVLIVIIILLVIYGIMNASRVTDEDRTRQMRRNEQTGREMYR